MLDCLDGKSRAGDVPSSSTDCAERRTAALFVSLKASAAIGLMDERMELMVIPLFVGRVVGLDTGWIGGPPVGVAGVSADVGASVHFDAVLGTEAIFAIESSVGGGIGIGVGSWNVALGGGLDSCICN